MNKYRNGSSALEKQNESLDPKMDSILDHVVEKSGAYCDRNLTVESNHYIGQHLVRK